MQNDERIPNLASKFKSDNIWPSFWPKAVENRINRVCCQFSTIFWTKRVSNVIRFELWGQIWNPFIILHLLGPYLIWFSHFDCLTAYAIFFNNCGRWWQYFWENVNFDELIVISVKKRHQIETRFQKSSTNWTTLIWGIGVGAPGRRPFLPGPKSPPPPSYIP